MPFPNASVISATVCQIATSSPSSTPVTFVPPATQSSLPSIKNKAGRGNRRLSWIIFLQCVRVGETRPLPEHTSLSAPSLLFPTPFSAIVRECPFSLFFTGSREELWFNWERYPVQERKHFQRELKFSEDWQGLYCLDLAAHSNEI